eukprot:scaffold3984_cov103-Isochrysis_galbana.AAC.4
MPHRALGGEGHTMRPACGPLFPPYTRWAKRGRCDAAPEGSRPAPDPPRLLPPLGRSLVDCGLRRSARGAPQFLPFPPTTAPCRGGERRWGGRDGYMAHSSCAACAGQALRALPPSTSPPPTAPQRSKVPPRGVI